MRSDATTRSNPSIPPKAGAPPRPAPPRLIPVPQWPEHHPWPSVAGLRWLIFNARENGFDQVVRRVGRRVLVDEQAFFRWVESRNGVGPVGDTRRR